MLGRKPAPFEYSSKKLEEIWSNPIISIDTSSLLKAFESDISVCNAFLDVLEKQRSKLWICGKVAEEYDHGLETIRQERADSISQLALELTSAAPVSSKKKNPADGQDKAVLPEAFAYPAISKAIKAKEAAIEKIRIAISEFEKEDSQRFEALRKKFEEVFRGKIGQKFSRQVLHEKLKEASFRYSCEIPPGYKDRKNANNFGDIIIWFQLMQKAKVEKRHMIFVTNDLKEDWAETLPSGKKVSRRDLVEEMEEVAGQCFVLYPLSEFIEAAQKNLKEKPNQDAINKAKETEKADEVIEIVDFEGNPIPISSTTSPFIQPIGGSYFNPFGIGSIYSGLSGSLGMYGMRSMPSDQIKNMIEQRESLKKSIDADIERLRSAYDRSHAADLFKMREQIQEQIRMLTSDSSQKMVGQLEQSKKKKDDRPKS